MIYDAIPTWLIAGLNGQIRDMNTIGDVEISGLFDDGSGRSLTERIDNKVNGADADEVDLQRRAIAKHVYKVLIRN